MRKSRYRWRAAGGEDAPQAAAQVLRLVVCRKSSILEYRPLASYPALMSHALYMMAALVVALAMVNGTFADNVAAGVVTFGLLVGGYVVLTVVRVRREEGAAGPRDRRDFVAPSGRRDRERQIGDPG